MATTITRYHFHNPQEIFDLAQRLAEPFLNPDVMIGVYELLLNAVEHGNLGMDSGDKMELMRQGIFSDEMARRMALPENADKVVEVEWEDDGDCYRLAIRDQGPGFNWQKCLNMDPRTPTAHGRGLMIAKHCGFDRLTYNAKGNSVTCIVKAKPASTAFNRSAQVQMA